MVIHQLLDMSMSDSIRIELKANIRHKVLVQTFGRKYILFLFLQYSNLPHPPA